MGFLRSREVWCVRPPHKHGDHQNEAGERWSSYEGEYDAMLQMTTDDLRALLASEALESVLYVARDGDTGEPVRLEVGPQAHTSEGDILVRQHELVDALGGPYHPDGVTQDALEHFLEIFQAEIDQMEEDSGNR